MHLLVTRPAAQAAAWVEGLAALGVPALALPLITIEAPADAAAVPAAWARLATLRFVMFVSSNAVQRFFAARPQADPPAPAWPAGLRAGATGRGTAQALREAGVAEADIVQPADGGNWDAEALWARIAGDAWRGATVLVVRGEEGRDWLAEQWRVAGAAVQFVAAYRRAVPTLNAAQREVLADAQARPGQHRWLFSSSEAIDNLGVLAPGADWRTSSALATHPRIADTARQAGFGAVRLTQPEPAAVAAAWHQATSKA